MAIAIPHPLRCKKTNTAQGFQSRGPGFHAAIFILALSALTGCGVPGAPLPPSAEIPKFVGDLKAQRKGATVTLTWTTPTETSDGELIRKPGKMLVQRALRSGSAPNLQFQTISELPLKPTLTEGRGEQATAKDTLTDALRSGGAEFAVYSILAQGRNGKSFGLPNRASVSLAPDLAPPHKVAANPVPAGIMISWDEFVPPENHSRLQTLYAYKVMRRLLGANEAVLVKQLDAGNQGMSFVDTGIEWEKTYQYWITPVTLWQDGNRKGEIEGDDSPTVDVLAHDLFPPAAPSGLQAVYSAMPQNSFIDLTWTANTEPDLAGYNVYRHSGSGPPVKINSELVKTPRFPDPNIQRGMKYFYAVTAVDLRGNESGKSEETSETVPKD
jgi:predicted small lipoprotein YifL